MIKIGVLYGGPHDEHDVSRASGEAAMKQFSGSNYAPVPICITREGQWQMYGMPVEPQEVAQHVSACLNTLHGHFGEGYNVRQILESLGVPYTGSSPAVSAMTLNRDVLGEIARRAGLRTPRSIVLSIPADIADPQIMTAIGREVHAKLSPPWVMETLVGNSRTDAHIARTMEELLLVIAQHANRDVIVTEYQSGKRATIATIEGFRGESVYATMPSDEGFSRAENESIAEAARTVHRALGIRDYATHEFVVTPRTMYFVGTTIAPSFHGDASLQSAITKTGISMPELISHIVSRAIDRR